jgi:hypothetical protein
LVSIVGHASFHTAGSSGPSMIERSYLRRSGFPAAGAVAEYPPIVPELVEPAEVAVDDPLLRLFGMGVAGPLVGALPQILIQ